MTPPAVQVTVTYGHPTPQQAACWAWLWQHLLSDDVIRCPNCGRPLDPRDTLVRDGQRWLVCLTCGAEVPA